jgi:hypothetical protein
MSQNGPGTLVRAIEASRTRPIIDTTLLFDETVPAFERQASGRLIGKVAIRVSH